MIRHFRVWLGVHILPRDGTAAVTTKRVNMVFTADTSQLDAALRRAKSQVEELAALTETLPKGHA